MRQLRRGSPALALTLCGALTALAPSLSPAKDPAPFAAEPTKVATVEGITEYRLANGLRVLLFPDPSTEKVTVNLTVLVGSRHEGYGETGMAHLLEHMVFKGTPTFPNVPKALRDHGAQFNGTTSDDRTNYFETMNATDANLEFGIHLEADRMVNSFVKREDLISEMTVVRNEFESGENSPFRILMQRIAAAAYEWHNYGKSTIGNRTDIERVPIDNLKAFYKQYYQPDNAVLIVGGKFDPAKALALVRKYFGPIPKPTRKLNATYTEEPPQDGERNVILRRVGKVGVVGVAYHVPAAAQADTPAVEVLSSVLAETPAGRLYQALVKTGKATRTFAFSQPQHDPGLLMAFAQTEPEKIEAARTALIDTLEKLADTPITAEEVDRAKQQSARRAEQAMDDASRMTMQLSEWSAKGDWRLFFVNRDAIAKVTADDVNRVAKKYLQRNNRTVGVFLPSEKAERAAVPETPAVAALVKDYKGRADVAAGEAFDPTPANIEARVRRGAIGGVKTAVLPKKTRGETVRLQLTLHFGNEESLRDQSVAAEMLGTLMQRGTRKHTRQQLQDELTKLSATLAVFSDLGDLTVSVQAKKATLPAVLKLIGEVLREPSFPAAEFEVLQRELREPLQTARTDPQALARRLLQRKLHPYPKGDVRYEPTIEEELDMLSAVTLEQVKKLYATQLGAGAGELAVVGDFDPDATLQACGEFLKGWKAEVPYRRIEKPAKLDIAGGREAILTPDKANAVYLAGMVFAETDADPTYPALVVGNYLLGSAPLASRLSVRVRGTEGLSYGVGSQLSADAKDKSGRFTIFAITNPVNIDKVDKAIQEEVEKFLKSGPTEKELAEGKKAYLESLKVRRASDAALASLLATNLSNGRTMDYYADLEKRIAALTPAQVQEAFQATIAFKKLIIIRAGDFQSAKPAPEPK